MAVELGEIKVMNPANEGKLLFVKGRLEVHEPLTEPEYGVIISAVRLKRRVQMYQWVEVQEEKASWWWGGNIDEGSPISYSTTWRDKLVDSSQFLIPYGHDNPKSYPLDSSVSVSHTVRVGLHNLGRELKDKFNSFIVVTSDQRPERRDIKMHSGLYYHSFDVWNPEVGDIRVQISYAGATNDVVTILARQVGDTLQPYHTGAEDLTMVLEGDYTLHEVLEMKFPSFEIWLIRVPAYFAFYCVFSSLLVLFDNGGKRGRVLFVFITKNKALLCHIFSSSTLFAVMGVIWFSYSPVLGSINIMGACVLLFYCFSKTYSLYSYKY